MRTPLVTAAAVGAAFVLASCSTAQSPDQPSSSPSATVPVAAPSVPADPDEALAAAITTGDTAAVSAALAAGADPELDLGAGVSALVAAVQRDDATMVAALLAAGADAQRETGAGRTPLMIAAQFAGAEVVGALLEAGARTDVFSTDVYNASALQAAVQGRNLATIAALLDGGADVNLVNPGFGATAMHAAAYWDCAECAAALYNAGANLAVRGLDGKTALDLARDRQAPETASFLEGVGAPAGESG